MCYALLLIALVVPGMRAEQVTVAAAANLSEVFPLVGQAFEAATKIHASFSFGSTAQLSQQLENGAPFDVFAAADTEHIDRLIAQNLLLRETRKVYATGVLALWFPARPGALRDLALPWVRTIAVAKPELAPYGQAAIETLRNSGLLERVRTKLVYAGNIGMARQYGASGNADAVFTAYSLVLNEHGRVIRLDESLHRPLAQAVGVVSRSGNRQAADRFIAFLLGPSGRQLLRKYGYR